MPRLWCGSDRWFELHAGRDMNAQMQLPIQCPLDHVFDIERGMSKKLIREYLLIENPRTAHDVLSLQHNLTLPTPLNAQKVKAALHAKLAKHKVLRITPLPPNIFQAVLTPREKREFMARAQWYTPELPPWKGDPGAIKCAARGARHA
jgi:hypothetical protein